MHSGWRFMVESACGNYGSATEMEELAHCSGRLAVELAHYSWRHTMESAHSGWGHKVESAPNGW